MKNNISNKIKFFAKYYGQDVLTVGNAICENTEEYWIEASLQHTQYLILNPISSISGKECIELGAILGYVGNDNIKINAAMDFINGGSEDCDLDAYIKVINFLTKNGYYLGNGIEIEYGWVKLKK